MIVSFLIFNKTNQSFKATNIALSKLKPHKAYTTLYTCVGVRHNGRLVVLRGRETQRGVCRCLCWGNMWCGDRSQYMLVVVPLAVKMLSWMWQTQWPLLCVEGGCCLWLGSRLPAQSPSPINSFMHSLKTSLYLCGLQERVTAAKLCVHPSQSNRKQTEFWYKEVVFFFKWFWYWKWKAGSFVNVWKHYQRTTQREHKEPACNFSSQRNNLISSLLLLVVQNML